MDNNDLLASHRIMAILEESKESSEIFIDEFPGIYALVNEDFRILRGNFQLASLLKSTSEEIIHSDFFKLFKPASVDMFRVQVAKVETLGNAMVSFELLMDGGDLDLSFYWTIKKIRIKKKAKERFYCVVGQNINELKDKEKKLGQIFGSIPLGVVVLGKGGVTEEEFSQQTFEILQNKEIAGRSFKEILFNACWTELLKKEKMAINGLADSVGKGIETFSLIKENLPKQIFYPIPELPQKGRWLELTYWPIVYNDIIKKTLLLIQDKTESILGQKLEEKSRILEDDTIARIVQLKRCDTELLGIFMAEIGALFGDLEGVLDMSDPQKLYATLHTIKGSARTAGFKFLTNFIHNLETTITKMMNSTRLDWAIIQLNIREIKNEWRLLSSLYESIILRYEGDEERKRAQSPDAQGEEVKGKLLDMYKILMGREQDDNTTTDADRIMLAIRNTKFVPLSHMESMLMTKLKETAKLLKKEVDLHFEWNRVRVDEKTKKDLNSCFLHLLTNAVDHGLETVEARENAGKPPSGMVKIRTWEEGDIINCTVSDDGQGLPLEKIKKKILERRLATKEELMDLREENIYQYIFAPGFSTQENVTEISGRGVGLDAVTSIIKGLKGSIHVENNPEGGTTFQFNLMVEKRINVVKKYYSVRSLASALSQRITYLNQQGFLIKFTGLEQDEKTTDGIIFCDLERIVLSLTNYIGQFADKVPAKVRFCQTSHLYQCIISGQVGEGVDVEEEESRSSSPHEERVEYNLAWPSCEDFIIQHGGNVAIKEGGMIVSTGGILDLDKLPVLHVGTNFEFSDPMFQEFLERFKSVATKSRLRFKFHEKTKLNMHIYLEDKASSEGGMLSIPSTSTKANIENILLQSVNILLRDHDY